MVDMSGPTLIPLGVIFPVSGVNTELSNGYNHHHPSAAEQAITSFSQANQYLTRVAIFFCSGFIFIVP